MSICMHCNKEYTPVRFKKGSRQKFCCRLCKDEYHKKNKREKNLKKHEIKPKICNHCKEQFVVRRRLDEKFCSPKCGIEYHKEQNRITTAKKRALVTKKCKLCEKEFSPQKRITQVYCSKRCRELIPKRAYQMLRRCMKLTKQSKLHHTHETLGYTPAQLQEHIMSHSNWEKVKDGPWHIDHIFPVVAFIEHNITDMSVICALENLQPLSDEDNHSKNGKYDKGQFIKFLKESL